MVRNEENSSFQNENKNIFILFSLVGNFIPFESNKISTTFHNDFTFIRNSYNSLRNITNNNIEESNNE